MMTELQPAWTLTLKDWRGLEHVSWSPHGVSLLAGPNGSGKTSILEALGFLRGVWLRGVNTALRWGRGAGYLRRLGARKDTPVVLALQVGELHWEVLLGAEGNGVHAYHGETLRRGKEVVFRRALFSNEWYLGEEKRGPEDRSCLRVLWDKDSPADVRPLTDFLEGIRSYESYFLNQIRRGSDSKHETDTYLHPTGRNLLWVLRNWKTAPRRFNGRFAWVLDQLKLAFPDQIEDIEFDAIGQAIQARFYSPNAPVDDSLPIHLAADGLLTGLLHLTAVAGAQPGALVAFDEIENQLHPHAIRSILASMRERADREDLTVVLTTHSPVVLNEFSGREDRIYVLESGYTGALPIPLDQLHDEAWLSHFALGDLYEREQFGAPKLPEAS